MGVVFWSACEWCGVGCLASWGREMEMDAITGWDGCALSLMGMPVTPDARRTPRGSMLKLAPNINIRPCTARLSTPKSRPKPARHGSMLQLPGSTLTLSLTSRPGTSHFTPSRTSRGSTSQATSAMHWQQRDTLQRTAALPSPRQNIALECRATPPAPGTPKHRLRQLKMQNQDPELLGSLIAPPPRRPETPPLTDP